jgi:hypothetical protein
MATADDDFAPGSDHHPPSTPGGSLGSGSPELVTESALSAARNVLRVRRARDARLTRVGFSDPAWDIMLGLYLALRENRPVSRSDAITMAAVPATTARRTVARLIAASAVTTHPDPSDRRRFFLRLNPSIICDLTLILDHHSANAWHSDGSWQSRSRSRMPSHMPANISAAPREFAVEGDGLFPVDMLCFDRCWPADHRDVRAIEIGHDDSERGFYRQVKLLSLSSKAPSFRRWRARGWIVLV